MKKITKKDLALTMRSAGRTVEEIASVLQCTPAYVANTLVAAGQSTDYSDLYTSSTSQNPYARAFAGILRFKNVDVARESVSRIDSLFHQYAEQRDRRGQHQAQMMALIGKNRAEGIGKLAEASVFRAWLVDHLDLDPEMDGEMHEPREHSEAEATESYPYDSLFAYA